MEPPGYLPHTASQTVELLTLEQSSTCEFAQEFAAAAAAVCSGGLTYFILTSDWEFLEWPATHQSAKQFEKFHNVK